MLFINKVLHLQHWAKEEKRERKRKITNKKHISIEQPDQSGNLTLRYAHDDNTAYPYRTGYFVQSYTEAT